MMETLDRTSAMTERECAKLEIRYQGLQAVNAGLLQRLKELAGDDESGAPQRLRAVEELQLWRRRYQKLEEEGNKGEAGSRNAWYEEESANESGSEKDALEKGLERLKRSRRKYKSAYLKLKKTRELDYLATTRTTGTMGTTSLYRSTQSGQGPLEDGFATVERDIRRLREQVSRKSAQSTIRII